MKGLFVCALTLLPLGMLRGQEATVARSSVPVLTLAALRAGELRFGAGLRSEPAVTESRFRFRPVLFGAVIGAGIGALVGHEVGEPYSCPGPGYSCDPPAFGTVGGAAIGMTLGAAVGAIVGMRQRHNSQGKLAPLIDTRGASIGLRYSRRF